MTTKAQMLQAIRELPDDATVEDGALLFAPQSRAWDRTGRCWPEGLPGRSPHTDGTVADITWTDQALADVEAGI